MFWHGTVMKDLTIMYDFIRVKESFFTVQLSVIGHIFPYISGKLIILKDVNVKTPATRWVVFGYMCPLGLKCSKDIGKRAKRLPCARCDRLKGVYVCWPKVVVLLTWNQIVLLRFCGAKFFLFQNTNTCTLVARWTPRHTDNRNLVESNSGEENEQAIKHPVSSSNLLGWYLERHRLVAVAKSGATGWGRQMSSL